MKRLRVLERLKKYYSQFGARIFGFWRGFGEGAGFQKPVTEPKRSQKPKGPLFPFFSPNGYSIFLTAPGLCFAVTLATGACLLAGCEKSAGSPPASSVKGGSILEHSEPTEAQPKLPAVKLYVGSEQMDAEMCVTPRQTETGMMFRKSMGTNDGMLFNLGYPQQASFWMKNCYVPLSVAYIDSEGVIEEIHPLQIKDETSVISTARDIRFALETPQGWFEQHHITTGMVIRTERGTLLQTFGQKQ